MAHSQPFWGNMIAAAGAGPLPIPHKALTAQKLADAITYCLGKEPTIIARKISERVKKESGVQAAVDSFHSNLPRHMMQCDLVPGQPAVWEFKKGKKTIQLSKIATWTLVHENRLQRKSLRM